MEYWDGVPMNYTAVRMNGEIGSMNERKRGGIRVSPELERINGDEVNGDSSGVKVGRKLKREDRESSTESSDSTNSSSSSSSSSSSAVAGARPSSLWEVDELGEHLQVTCAENEAKFYKNRFARGSIGRCVLFRGRWITPNEFQAISGRQSSKDWKRSIRLNGRCLKEYINDGLFKEHQKNCICSVCLGVDSDQLRQEGVMALAAKRRRLSQADGGSSTSLQNMEGVSGSVATPPITNNSEATPADGTSDKKLPGSVVKRKRKVGQTPKSQRVWSPSGEVAPDVSSNEDDFKSVRPLEDMEESPNSKPVIDASDFLPRRSKRTVHRKHVGHRTELGTFTHKPAEWDAEEVSEFLKLQGFADYSDTFLKGEINGQSMFLLREHHLLEQFQMKLGPALRLLDTISRLRHPPTQ